MSYTPRLDIAPESGSGALAAIYCRAIERYEERHAQTNAAGVTSTCDDAKERPKNDSRAKSIISK